ncbi:TIGR03032 family protein [Synechocystis sp. LKSZ1]|uniref:TIGR03032 family protein n=1 Tax=Synechocystis sp. LKSZ1 TaxID=3144951 RepID=UPI00336C2686
MLIPEQSLPQELEIPDQTQFEVKASRNLVQWLREQKVSLAFTTPPLKLFLIGVKTDNRLSIFERTFNRCLGIATTQNSLYLSTRYEIWKLENVLPQGQIMNDGYDKQYVPRIVYRTGFLGIHDVAVDNSGRVIFVNTRFGCLATLSERYSFIPLWHPPFLSGIRPGDRCHLNGLAMKDGSPAYVTSVSQTDEFDGWRQHRANGGCIVDVKTNDVIVTGLSMPHSPRWYQDRLWLTNSGTGEFGYVNFATGRFEPIVFAPGFLRGLCFVGDYAVVGSSKPRHGDIYSGLALDDALKKHGEAPRLGFFIINLRTGEIENWLLLEGNLRELYDVVALPLVRQPMALGLISEEIQNQIWFNPFPS